MIGGEASLGGWSGYSMELKLQMSEIKNCPALVRISAQLEVCTMGKASNSMTNSFSWLWSEYWYQELSHERGLPASLT